MNDPRGSLTAAQYEIMQVIWQAGADGVSVADVWQSIADQRTITRTTVLNQVDRLEKRGWLQRTRTEGATRFRATLSKEEASKQLVSDFVADYFQGSTVELVSALLGEDGAGLTKKEVERLRKLVDQARRRQSEGQS